MVSEERMLSESAALLQKRWVVTRERMPGSFHARKYCPWHPWECIAMLKNCSVLWPEKPADALLPRLLALLALGVKNIHLGPTLPAFLSPNVKNVLIEQFGIGGISTADEDIMKF